MLRIPESKIGGRESWRVCALGAACLFLLSGNWQTVRAGEAPWEKTAGPPGLQVTVIYKANSIVYAGTATQGVYKSTDDGISWAAANSGIELTEVHDLIASGGNLLAATSSKSFACPGANNVFKSTDSGNTWSPTSGLSSQIVNSFALKGSFVYAVFANLGASGIFRSSDNGDTWQSVASPIVKGDKVFVSDNAIIVASDNFIWRSLSDGASWTLVEQFALTGISSFARAGTKLFATGTTVIWTSLDNGGSWTLTPFSDGASSLSSDGSTIYLGSGSKVFKSTDMGGLGMMSAQVWAMGASGLYCSTEQVCSPGPLPTQREYTEAQTEGRAGIHLPWDCRSVQISAAWSRSEATSSQEQKPTEYTDQATMEIPGPRLMLVIISLITVWC